MIGLGDNVWERLHYHLDGDERLVFPEMYLENRNVYDGIKGVVYLVRDRKGPEDIEWISESQIGKVLKNYDVDLIGKLLVVTVRLPWSEGKFEWTVSQKELNENREWYDVLDIYLTVKHKDMDTNTFVFDKVEFESNRDNYEVIDVRYLVALKLNREEKARLLGIDPDSIHTYISE